MGPQSKEASVTPADASATAGMGEGQKEVAGGHGC